MPLTPPLPCLSEPRWALSTRRSHWDHGTPSAVHHFQVSMAVAARSLIAEVLEGGPGGATAAIGGSASPASTRTSGGGPSKLTELPAAVATTNISSGEDAAHKSEEKEKRRKKSAKKIRTRSPNFSRLKIISKSSLKENSFRGGIEHDD